MYEKLKFINIMTLFFHIIIRVTAGSGFEQMSDSRTVLGLNRPVNHVRRIEQIRIVRPAEQF